MAFVPSSIRDIIKISIQHHSYLRVFQPDAAEKVSLQFALAEKPQSTSEIIDLICQLLDEHTIYFGDDGPSPYMHMALMGEEVVNGYQGN